MDTTTQDRLNALLDYVGTTVKDGDALLREQAPLVVKEIVAWEFWSSIATIGMTTAILALAIALLFFCMKKAVSDTKSDIDWSEPAAALLITAAILGVVWLVVVPTNAMSAVKASTAPRLVVLDYLKSAVK